MLMRTVAAWTRRKRKLGAVRAYRASVGSAGTRENVVRTLIQRNLRHAAASSWYLSCLSAWLLEMHLDYIYVHTALAGANLEL
jgi:hypothetical protein